MKVPPFATKLCVFSLLFYNNNNNNNENTHNLVAKGGTFIEYCYITRNRMQNQKIKSSEFVMSPPFPNILVYPLR
jgi:hypothetical protein